MKTQIKTLVIAGLLAGYGASSAIAGAAGTWKRPNGSTAKVWMCGGGLCGSSKGTRMFNGIKKVGKNRWKGDMKHPEMPGFMTFNGTVSVRGKTMTVQGCMFGGSGCQSEVWKKK